MDEADQKPPNSNLSYRELCRKKDAYAKRLKGIIRVKQEEIRANMEAYIELKEKLKRANRTINTLRKRLKDVGVK